MENVQFVDNISFLEPLPDELKEKLSKMVLTKNVAKGDVLFQENDIAETIFFVNNGKIKISKSSPGGKEIVLDIRKAGEIFPEVALFSKEETTYSASASVVEFGSISMIRKADLESILLQYPELFIFIFRTMAERLRLSQNTLQNVALYGKIGSLAFTLVRLCQDYGEVNEHGITIRLKLTHEDLGSFFGATRESVTRMMNQLKNRGIVSKENGYFTVHELDSLKFYID
ncbi:Crp/Fnr family transcriptional regulator [Texcoconibacillus texcoconensis]|uniref:CRP/FNR family transcriptional regulator n=1 Tax=Texcoconibacillus texcoconensis TaxID=1095777 RepID=A0A840QU36_9BACI|nr:Crp/Fnr family transcriptional regulator [Texcoconibacillus texcoconensis]MBB5174809.1 CRP/FNR family transcriptional regulator [Texcoconibacillus texcoconensis]